MSISTAELALLIRVQDEASAALERIDKKGGGLIGTFKALVPAIIGFGAAFASWEVIGNAIEKTAELGKEVYDLNLNTGLSEESASHLIHAADDVGVSYETMSKSLIIFAKNVTAATRDETKAGEELSDSQRQVADQVRDAQERMKDATQDASYKMSDATRDATSTMAMALRDRNEAVRDSNHDLTVSTQDMVNQGRDLMHQYDDIMRDSARSERDISTDIQRAQRDLLKARADHAAGVTKTNDSVIRAEERLHDLQIRLNDSRIDSAEKLKRNGEKMNEHNQKVTETQYQAQRRKQEIDERYSDTAIRTQEQLARTARDTSLSLQRAYREGAEAIAKAHATVTKAQTDAEVNATRFGAALTDLGLKMSDVVDDKGKLTEEGFQRIAQKVKDMGPSLQRTADLTALFGRNGAALGPLMDQGAAGLKEAAEQSDRLGLTLSKDNVEKIRQYAKSHREMDDAIKGVQLRIGMYLMPKLTEFANWVVEHQPEIVAFVDKAIVYIDEKIGKLGEVIDYLMPAFETFYNGWVKIFDYLGEHETALMIVIGALVLLAVALQPIPIMILAIAYTLAYMAENGWFDKIAEGFAFLGKAAEFGIGLVKLAFAWIKENWPLIVAILAGPIGMAALQIVKHFDTIKSGAKSVIDFISSIPEKIGDAATKAFQTAKRFGSNIVNGILEGLGDFAGGAMDIAKGIEHSVAHLLNSQVIDRINGVEVHIPHVGDFGIPDKFKIPHIPEYEIGSRYIARDSLAMLHAGESVRTATETKNDRLGMNAGGGVTVNFNGKVSLQGASLKSAASTVGFALMREKRAMGAPL